MNAAIERMIVEGMVIKRKRERALFELSHPQKRDHFLWLIEQYLEPSLFHRIIVDSPQDAYSLLKERGAPEDCYILSRFKAVDGTFAPLRQMLTWENVDSAGLISCIPGQLAYWHGEYGDHYLLYADRA